jgi:hypothetical protein
MGVPVTVDSDDLEALLYATAAIRGIENALASAQRDPMFEIAKPRFSAAFDAVANAMRGAIRSATMPNIMRDPEGEDLQVLLHLARACAVAGVTVLSKPHMFRHLVGMGVVEIGPHDERVVFASGSGDIWHRRSPDQRIRVTQRGFDFIPDWQKGEGETWFPEDSRRWLETWQRRVASR